MKLGLALMVENQSISDGVKLAQRGEAAGFESVWCGEYWHGSWVPASAIMNATHSIRVGTGITWAFTRSPFVCALSALDLDEISDGRFTLSLGAPPKRMLEDWHSTPFHPPVPRMREYVDCLRSLWKHWAHRPYEPFEFEGKFYQLKVDGYARELTEASDNIPVYLGAVNPLMVRLAGEIADGLLGHPLYPKPYLAKQVIPAVGDGLGRSSRDRSTIDVASLVICSVASDRKEARRLAKYEIGFHVPVKSFRKILDDYGFAKEREAIRVAFERGDIEGMADAVSEEMVDAIAIAGTQDDCLQQLKFYEPYLDVIVLHAPSCGVPRPRVMEGFNAIIHTFGQG